jgi:nucleoside-diphosphate-sugar epimerase
MKALITGATGFIGRNLCEHLLGTGVEYDTVGRDWYHTLDGSGQYDLVFYLAGEVRNPAKMYEANVKFLYRILSVSLKWNCMFVYIGSSSEYGRMPRAMRESDQINPSNLYEATKGMGTLLCQGFAREFHRPIAIFRPSSVYGKYERPEKFVPTVVRKIKAGEEVDVYPGVHDYIFVDDFISAIFTEIIQENLQESPEGVIYNVSSGVQTSNQEIVKIVGEVMGKRPDIKEHAEFFHKHDTMSWGVDNTKIKSLGWRPKYDLRTGLEKTAREILEEMNK